MATAQMYYSSQDIQTILNIGKRKANEILHMFEQRGELFRDGRTLRVRIDYFNNWLDRKDGPEVRQGILNKKFQT